MPKVLTAFRIEKTLLVKLKEYAKQNDMSMSQIVRKLLRDLLIKKEEP